MVNKSKNKENKQKLPVELSFSKCFVAASALNGNQGSWTNSDDVDQNEWKPTGDAIPGPCPLRQTCDLCLHWHKKGALEGAARRLAEKKSKEDEKKGKPKVERSPCFVKCTTGCKNSEKHDPAFCSLHFHSPRDFQLSENGVSKLNRVMCRTCAEAKSPDAVRPYHPEDVGYSATDEELKYPLSSIVGREIGKPCRFEHLGSYPWNRWPAIIQLGFGADYGAENFYSALYEEMKDDGTLDDYGVEYKTNQHQREVQLRLMAKLPGWPPRHQPTAFQRTVLAKEVEATQAAAEKKAFSKTKLKPKRFANVESVGTEDWSPSMQIDDLFGTDKPKQAAQDIKITTGKPEDLVLPVDIEFSDPERSGDWRVDVLGGDDDEDLPDLEEAPPEAPNPSESVDSPRDAVPVAPRNSQLVIASDRLLLRAPDAPVVNRVAPVLTRVSRDDLRVDRVIVPRSPVVLDPVIERALSVSREVVCSAALRSMVRDLPLPIPCPRIDSSVAMSFVVDSPLDHPANAEPPDSDEVLVCVDKSAISKRLGFPSSSADGYDVNPRIEYLGDYDALKFITSCNLASNVSQEIPVGILQSAASYFQKLLGGITVVNSGEMPDVFNSVKWEKTIMKMITISTSVGSVDRIATSMYNGQRTVVIFPFITQLVCNQFMKTTRASSESNLFLPSVLQWLENMNLIPGGKSKCESQVALMDIDLEILLNSVMVSINRIHYLHSVVSMTLPAKVKLKS